MKASYTSNENNTQLQIRRQRQHGYHKTHLKNEKLSTFEGS